MGAHSISGTSKEKGTGYKIKKERSTLLGEFLNFRQEVYASMDSAIFGNGYLKKTTRSRFNPMYWILGEKKLKRIDPRKTNGQRYGYSATEK
mgnify:CR=1 FL=1